jgi:phenylacetate-CoA ligase
MLLGGLVSVRSDLHKYLIRYLGNPFILLWTGDYSILREIKEYDKIYTLPREKLFERQWQKLQRLVKEAYENCPYYAELFDREGIKPENVQSPADFARIPPLTKPDIRKHRKELLSRKADKKTLSESATAGSTDVPLQFWRSKETVCTKWAQTGSLNKWYGWEIGDKAAYLWAATQDFYLPKSLKGKIREFLTSQDVMLPARPLSREILENYRQKLVHYSPEFLQGYPQSLHLLAAQIESGQDQRAEGIWAAKPFPELRAIISTAEPLYDFQRQKLEEVFSCDVYDRYGAREIGLIATECPQAHSLHINTEGVYLEVVAKGRPGGENEIGEILVTDLVNTTMPFIRYQIKDLGSLTQEVCKCGCELPLMKSITGRTADIVVLPDGRFILGMTFPITLTKHSPGISQVQVIQEELTSFTVRYVPAEDFTESDLAALKRSFHEILAEDLDLRLERVDEIARDPSGKSRFCISKVKLDFLQRQ